MAISHVGGMPSLLEAVDVARAQGATIIAITQAGTPLARMADIVLAIEVPPDPVMPSGTEAYLAHLTVSRSSRCWSRSASVARPHSA